MNCSEKNIIILYTKFEDKLPDFWYNKLLNLLPVDQKERNQQFVGWQDRYSHLFGRMLLKCGLEVYGYEENCLTKVQYNKYDRPYLNDKLDFNISHSGNYVICAMGLDLKLGIDIEKVQEIEFKDFKSVMTEEQWHEIKYSESPLWFFYRYWTIKESVIKADSRGLSIPLQDIQVKNNKVEYDNSIWYLFQLNIDSEYCACLATNATKVNISFKFIDFYKFRSLW